MLKLKKLISLACAVCVAGTGAIVTGLMGTSASAAAADAASCINTDKSFAPTSMGKDPASGTNWAGASTYTKGSVLDANNLMNGESIITSTSKIDTSISTSHTFSGTLNSSKKTAQRIALRNIGCVGEISYNESEATILHVGWDMTNTTGTVIDILYTYTYNSNSLSSSNKENGVAIAEWQSATSGEKRLLGSGSKTNGTYDYQAYVNPNSYHADWFVDCATATYRLYIDNTFFSEGSFQNASGNYYLRNLYFRLPTGSDSYNYTISNPVFMTYKKVGDITPTMDDVVAYTLTKDTSRGYWWPTNCRNDGYYWRSTGIGAIDGAASNRLVGGTSSIKNGSGAVDTNDSTKYIVKPTTDSNSADYSGVGWRLRANAGNSAKGNLPKDAENNNIIVQSATITPNLTEGKHGAIGFRGYTNVSVPQPDRYKFSAADGFVNGTGYDFDIILNYDGANYMAYIVVEGKLVWQGPTWTSGYLSEIVYSLENAGGNDTLTLSNMTTTMYDSTVDVYDILEQEVTDELYATVSAGSLSGTTLSCNAEVIGAEEILGAGNTGKLVFAAFDNGRFLSYDIVDFTNNAYLNGAAPASASIDLSGASSGDTIKINVFLWDGLGTVKPLSNVGSCNYRYTTE